MKITEIKADGTGYWFERANDWGNYLRADYSRGQVKRVDEKRYYKGGPDYRPFYREDVKGKYILVERVAGEDYPGGDQMHVLAAQVRDEYDAVKARYEATQAARKSAAVERQQTIDAMNDRADALRARLVETGLDTLIHVQVTGQNAWRNETLKVTAEFGHGSEDKLDRLLALLEGRKANI